MELNKLAADLRDFPSFVAVVSIASFTAYLLNDYLPAVFSYARLL